MRPTRLFFDTETTGKADFKAPHNADCQPRLVQLAAVLTDSEGGELQAINVIVAPSGFSIPDEAAKIHGITTEKALAFGIPIKTALSTFWHLWSRADLVVGFNLAYDSLIINNEMFRAKGNTQPWGLSKETFDVMSAMTDVCKLPGKYGTYKWPSLQEAHQFYFGEAFAGAHGAMEDVRATFKVYMRWLEENKVH